MIEIGKWYDFYLSGDKVLKGCLVINNYSFSEEIEIVTKDENYKCYNRPSKKTALQMAVVPRKFFIKKDKIESYSELETETSEKVHTYWTMEFPDFGAPYPCEITMSEERKALSDLTNIIKIYNTREECEEDCKKFSF